MLWPLHICIWFLCVADNLVSQTFLLFLQDGLPNTPSRIVTDEKQSGAGNQKLSKHRAPGLTPPEQLSPGAAPAGLPSAPSRRVRQHELLPIPAPRSPGSQTLRGSAFSTRQGILCTQGSSRKAGSWTIINSRGTLPLGWRLGDKGAAEVSPVPYTGTRCPGSPTPARVPTVHGTGLLTSSALPGLCGTSVFGCYSVITLSQRC